MKIEKFATTKAEEAGVWVKHEDAEFLIASLDSNAYQVALESEMTPHRRRFARGTLDRETREACVTKAASRHLLLGWKNVTKGSEEVKYSPELAEKLMTDYPKLRSFVLSTASNEEMYQAEADKETVAASKNVSAGS